MSVSIRELQIGKHEISLLWVVKNTSEYPLTFNENQIIQVELNGSKVLYPTNSTQIDPNEETILNLSLKGIDTEQINQIILSAVSNEGAKGTVKQTVYPPPTNK